MTEAFAYQETKKLFFPLVIARKQPKSVDQGPNCSIEEGHRDYFDFPLIHGTIYFLK
jgi:hypothetical protein